MDTKEIQERMTTDLQPCPWCGSNAVEDVGYGASQRAIAAWNALPRISKETVESAIYMMNGYRKDYSSSLTARDYAAIAELEEFKQIMEGMKS